MPRTIPVGPQQNHCAADVPHLSHTPREKSERPIGSRRSGRRSAAGHPERAAVHRQRSISESHLSNLRPNVQCGCCVTPLATRGAGGFAKSYKDLVMLGLASSHTPVRQELVVLRFRHCAVPLKTASSVRLTPHREAADKESGSISMGDSEIVCSLLTTVVRLRSDPIGRAPSQVVRSMVERMTVSRSTNSVYKI